MIAKLTGRIDAKEAEGVILDVAGVGYLVQVSARTAARLPPPGGAASLLIEPRLKEDSIALFGFADADERGWFRLLNTVQAVGPRVALAILSVLSPADLLRAIAAQDRAMLQRADGVGAKLALRIVTELKDKAAGLALGQAAAPVAAAAAPAGGDAADGEAAGAAEADAVSALVNLGYGRAEAFGAVGQAARRLGGTPALTALIPAALKELAG
ncbi:MAG: Holliday junction branch migration protein RuvA [Thalassobaculales bacterium]